MSGIKQNKKAHKMGETPSNGKMNKDEAKLACPSKKDMSIEFGRVGTIPGAKVELVFLHYFLFSSLFCAENSEINFTFCHYFRCFLLYFVQKTM